ncbi:MAG: HAMP domain-containing histidine kinase [Muribaculaceae bacterium]|nr:HAMP domain-containing histidine kinase [Muribaculaceae bacterium]
MASLTTDKHAKGPSHRPTYASRLFLWLLTYSIIMVTCFVAFQYKREKDFKAAEMDAQLQLINRYLLQKLYSGCNLSEISAAHISPFENLRISVFSENGNILYDNTAAHNGPVNHSDRLEITQAMNNTAGYAVRRHSESTGEYYFYSALKGNGFIVRTAVPYSISLDSLLKADYGFLWAMGAITALMCLLGYFATRRIGLTVSRLNRFADDVENGKVVSDSAPFPHDELGDIAGHIIRLYARLQQSNIERDIQHRAATHEQKEKERIKKQLTNNINHELKTPLASVKLCIETLVEHKHLTDQQREQIMQRCLANISRLEHLLSDISLITRMDDGGSAITTSDINLSDIINEVVDEKIHAASANGISITHNFTQPLPMTGNAALLESVFNNLIDNAVAYSGGSAINIRLVSADSQSIYIDFSDNGSGIPPEHLERIFERFYRIDKGRSRAMGGTGLGLSIVKNAVIFHGGDITVANARNGGLKFSIRLRRKHQSGAEYTSC